MYLDIEKNRYKFLFCINNLYGHSFEHTFEYIKDVMGNLFNEKKKKKIIESCGINEEILKKYGLIKNSINEELITDNITSDRFPQIKLIQYLIYL